MSQLSAEHGHGHDEHPAHLAHHFESPGQQFSSGKLGMWLFLATEILFFGGLFVFYSVYRSHHPDIFAKGSEALDWKMGGINTVVLILSSLTMAWAVTATQQGKKNLVLVLLGLTFLGGAGFMTIKFFEYKHKIHEGLVWGAAYNPQTHGEESDHAENGAASSHDEGNIPGVQHEAAGPDYHEGWDEYGDVTVEVSRTTVLPASLGPQGSSTLRAADTHDDPDRVWTYFSIYFCLTGLHGIHVVIGMGIIAWLWFHTYRGRFGADYFTPVDLGGLYWHLVDLIWIFLFPLLYLI